MLDSQTFLEVPGLRFVLETDRPELIDISREVFSASVPTASSPDGDARTITIQAKSDESAPEAYSQLRVDGEFINDMTSEGVLVNYIETVVTDKLARHFTDYVLIHSGAVASGSRGILLPGASGNGKSTTTTCLALSGFTYYSDEMAVLSSDAKRLFPFPKLPGLKTGGRKIVQETFKDAARAVYSPEIDNVTYFEPHSLPGPAEGSEGVQIDFVLLPRRPEPGETLLEPVRKSEALRVLIEESLDLELRHAAGFDALTTIVNNADCYVVKFGDVHAGIGLVQELVSGK